ncbi:MAG: NUDIX domain-containing protein [Candidatus Shapirobacteria bacterium]|nr:NUDIX domain-containing protein [Candidatus Shapirobacteria bacterium]MDD5481910.1 NUDIX domain-containing protein [Candidatus Shapirobacteria bacterium]
MRRQFSAGGVVYKKEGDKTLWLLIQPKDTNRWQFPKGWIEEGETAPNAALREIKEEAGIVGEIVEKIGSFSWWFVEKNEKVFKTATFFLVKTQKDTGQLDEKEIERVAWFSFDEAREKLTFDQDKETLTKAQGILASRLF